MFIVRENAIYRSCPITEAGNQSGETHRLANDAMLDMPPAYSKKLTASKSYSPSTSHRHRNLPSRISAAEDSRTGILVRRRNRVVDVDEDARIGRLVGAGEGNLVRGLSASAACDAKLGARDVELGTP